MVSGGKMKNTWIIANWKSNKNIADSLDWITQVGPKLVQRQNLKVVVCPGFSALEEVKKAILVGHYQIMVGSQDLSPFKEGPYTGEESAHNLAGMVELAILGHSERRRNFGESDEVVSSKVDRALEAGIIPLVCIQGEETPVPPKCKLVAYEPIFAIGSGFPDSPESANNIATALKQKNTDLEVLYGGSVNGGNVASFLSQENISGVLVGTASLLVEEFLAVIENSI